MSSIEFTKCRDIPKDWDVRFRDLQIPEVKRVGVRFAANVDRIRFTANVPTAMAYKAFATMSLWQQSGGDSEKFIEIQGSNAFSPEEEAKITRLAERCVKGAEDIRLGDGLRAILEGIVIGAWTSFEVLAGDLWVESLMLKPDPLAKASFANSFPPDRIGVEKKVRQLMRRAEGIRGRYQEAFSETATAVLFAIQAFSDVLVLEGVRNLLVHKAGIVDAMFLTRVGEHADEYRRHNLHAMQLGDVLTVDGNLAKNLANSAVAFSTELLNFVDGWFATHP